MADVSYIDIKDESISVMFKVSKEEYGFMGQDTSDLMILPTSPRFMDSLLTTGRLGNSNRLMLPKKILDRMDVQRMDRKVSSRIFRLNGNVYLLTRLSGREGCAPAFGRENV